MAVHRHDEKNNSHSEINYSNTVQMYILHCLQHILTNDRNTQNKHKFALSMCLPKYMFLHQCLACKAKNKKLCVSAQTSMKNRISKKEFFFSRFVKD